MNGTEERLRSALHHSADEVDVDEFGSLDRIRARGATARRHRAVLRTSVGALGAAAALVGVLVLRDDGRTSVVIPPVNSPTTTEAGPTTTSTTPSVPATVVGVPAAVFPASPRFTEPGAAGAAFLSDYLHTPAQAYATADPVVNGSTATIEVHGRNEGGGIGSVKSTLTLELHEGYWYVMGAASDSVVVESPTGPSDCCSRSPVTVTGQGRGYEGQIVAEVLDDHGNVLGSNFTTASGGLDLMPFSVDVPIDSAPSSTGALYVHNSTGLENGPVEFTVVKVALPVSAANSVNVYFHDADGNLVAVSRPKQGTGVLRTALVALLEGPTAEEQAQGLTSVFSEKTAGLLLGVTIDSGKAAVDFDGKLTAAASSASTAAGGQAFLAELNATVFQFTSVQSVEYRLGGDCAAFWTWLQVGTCTVVPRP